MSANIAAELVDQLSPPLWRPNAAQWLAEIRRALEDAEAREAVWSSQPTDEAERQLRAARKALGSFGPRVRAEVAERLDEALREQFPTIPAAFFSDGEAQWGIPRGALSDAVVTALDRSVMTRRPTRDGTLSRPARITAISLANLFCATHDVPFPSFDPKHNECRDRAAACFALECLIAWQVAGAAEVDAVSLVRSLEGLRD